MTSPTTWGQISQQHWNPKSSSFSTTLECAAYKATNLSMVVLSPIWGVFWPEVELDASHCLTFDLGRRWLPDQLEFTDAHRGPRQHARFEELTETNRAWIGAKRCIISSVGERLVEGVLSVATTGWPDKLHNACNTMIQAIVVAMSVCREWSSRLWQNGARRM